MTTVAPALLIGLVLTASSLPVAMGARRLATARDRNEAAATSLTTTRERGQRVLDLRASAQRVAERKRPEQDVIARVNAALREAGLGEGVLGGVRTQGDTVVGNAPAGGGNGPEYRRQSVRLTLRRLTTPELGRFLAAWSSTQDAWTPTLIDLAHDRAARDGEHRFNTTIVIAATYIAER